MKKKNNNKLKKILSNSAIVVGFMVGAFTTAIFIGLGYLF